MKEFETGVKETEQGRVEGPKQQHQIVNPVLNLKEREVLFLATTEILYIFLRLS